MRRLASRLVLAVMLSATALSELPAAQAMDYSTSFLPPSYFVNQDAFRHNLNNATHNGGNGTQRAAAGGAVRRPYSRTAYTTSPAISAQIMQTVAADVARESGSSPDVVLAQFRRDNIYGVWQHRWAPVLRPGDVADAYASYMIANWMVANQVGSFTQAQARGALRQIAATLGNNTKVTSLSNAERQGAADNYMLRAEVSDLEYTGMRQHGRADMIQTASDQAEQRFKDESNIDLRSMALTNQGFVPRP